MFKTLFIALAVFSSSALAADPPVWSNEPAASVPAYNWSGIYVGAYGGAGAIISNIELPGFGPGNFNGVGGEGLIGGVMAGYNLQMGNLVVGLQGEVGLARLRTELKIPGFVALEAYPDWDMSLSGRLGWTPIDRAMVYAIAGYSYMDSGVEIITPGGTMNFSQDYHGWHAGLGVDVAISDRFFAGVEYRYTQYGGEDWGTGGVLDVDPSSHTGRLKAGFRF